MSPATRIFARRSSAVLRNLARRQAPSARPAYMSGPTGRGYASAHGAAEKTSDMPWLLSAIGVTVVGVGLLYSTSPAKGGSAHHSAEHHAESESESTSSDSSDSSPSSDSDSSSSEEAEAGEGEDEDKPKGAADPSSPGKASQSGQNVPPASGDSADLAAKWDEKKEGQAELMDKTRAGESRVATSASNAPSKKTGAEDPREDPQKGEGEGVQKGASKN